MAQFCKIAVSLTVILVSYEAVAFQQNDYNLTNERMEIKEYDKKWIEVARIKNFKYNRTHTAVNISYVIARALDNLQVGVQAYRFASNEYRLFPLSFTTSACTAIEQNDFGLQNFFKCGNFSGCPLVKGSFQICNWIPDESKFPPHVPSGRYLLELKMLQRSTQVALVQWYIKIEKKFHYV